MEKSIMLSSDGLVIIDTFRTRDVVNASPWEYWATYQYTKRLANTTTVQDTAQINGLSIDSLARELLADRGLTQRIKETNYRITSTAQPSIHQGTQVDRLEPNELQELYTTLYRLQLEKVQLR